MTASNIIAILPLLLVAILVIDGTVNKEALQDGKP